LLTSTFSHIEGVGAHTERDLWKQGCHTWDDFLADPKRWTCGSRQLIKDSLGHCRQALSDRNHQHFAKMLGARNTWRAWPDFRDKMVCLDIETDGGPMGESITVIGLWNGQEFTCLTRDEGLGALPDILSEYQIIVTFFGAGFDLPMIQKRFPRLRMDQLHIDLSFVLRQDGIRGGLKKIEKEFGITRSQQTDGLTGRDAIRLWREYERGSQSSLDTLIAYNREDVVNLERLADIAYDRLRRRTLADAGVLRTFLQSRPEDAVSVAAASQPSLPEL
jgi:uncharacterized protein YprB with RNaseH-like and TPR domain